MPASDADIDYALSLVFADAIWKGQAPAGNEDYGQKAKKVLDDILRLETFSTYSGRLYLAPWILPQKETLWTFPINPSYYSPAHFYVFYKFTGDEKWLKLRDSSYFVASSLAREIKGSKGVGLVPDWASVDSEDVFSRMEGKNANFSWDAVRVPIRLYLDQLWFGNQGPKDFFGRGFTRFAGERWRKDKAIYSAYTYTGRRAWLFDNPIYYVAAYCAFKSSGSGPAGQMRSKADSWLKKRDYGWVYVNDYDYYSNSLSWIADGIEAGIIKDLTVK
jgi:endoglucanase